ncbi:MAG: DUF3592 domain-containing protein [Desulfuromonas sp.]|nr:DUF3592 domain-containing protein [Desulfuromonas sp.]
MSSSTVERASKAVGQPWFLYLFLSIFLVVGVGCLLYAPVKAVRTLSLIHGGATAVGTVIDIHSVRGSRSTTYAPEVGFSAEDGRPYRFRSQISEGSSEYFIGQQVPVSYDPASPGNAEIRAFVPLWMPVIILFSLGTAFTAVSAGGIHAARRSVENARLLEAAHQSGRQEWEANPDWRTGTIRSATGREAWFYCLFALVWNVIGQPTGYLVVHEVMTRANYWAIIGLMFPLAGFWLFWLAISKTLQVRTFGDIRLQMDPFPATIGGDAGGIIELPVRYDHSTNFVVSLYCERISQTRNGSHREVVWQEESPGVTAPGIAGTRVSFRIAVPASEPPSSDNHQWSARLTAELPGIDLDRTFILPVIREETPRASSLAVPLANDLARHQPVPAATVRIDLQANGLCLHYPCRRNLKNGLLLIFFSAWFLFFTALFVVKAPVTGLFILPVFGLLGVALLMYAIWQLGNSLTVTIAARQLVTVRRFFGIRVKASETAFDLVTSIETKHFGTRGSGASAKLIYAVAAVCADGTRITVGDGIEGRAAAEEIARRVRQSCGMLPANPAAPVAAVDTGETARNASGDDAPTMTCPKCGTVQPETATCNKCQLIVSRYHPRQELLRELRPKSADAARFIVSLLLVAMVCLSLAAGIYAWRTMQANAPLSPVQSGPAAATAFHSNKFGFSLTVPADWKVLTVDEAIQCATIRKEYADQYLFMATPTTPDDALLVVDIAGVSLTSFRSMGWDEYVALISSHNRVERNEITSINGITAHRIGYEVAGKYREDILFETGNTLMEIYFYVPLAAGTADQASRFRNIIDQTLQRL